MPKCAKTCWKIWFSAGSGRTTDAIRSGWLPGAGQWRTPGLGSLCRNPTLVRSISGATSSATCLRSTGQSWTDV